MPRNKIVKRSSKRKSINNVLADIQKMETELLKIPAKLVAQLDKNVDIHQRKENKLKKAVNKIHSSLIQAEEKIKTTANQKVLKKAKKTYKNAVKTHSELDNQLQQITHTLNTLLDKQDKIISLDKHLRQFEKEWNKSAKKSKSSKNPKIKTKKTAGSPELTIVDEANVSSSHHETAKTEEPTTIAS